MIFGVILEVSNGIKSLSKQLLKKDFTHCPRLKTIAVREDEFQSYEKSVKCLHIEFERSFQDFKVIEQDLNTFNMPFHVDGESVKPELHLWLSCNVILNWSNYFSFLKLSSTRLLSTSSFPNLKSHVQKIIAKFASSYICEQVLSTMTLCKDSVRNRLTDHHLATVLWINSFQFLPGYEQLLGAQSQSFICHIRLHTLLKNNQFLWLFKVLQHIIWVVYDVKIKSKVYHCNSILMILAGSYVMP